MSDIHPVLADQPLNTDFILPFAVPDLDVRGRVVLLNEQLDEIMQRHQYPDPVTSELAQTVVLTVLIGSSMKFDGRFILQAHTQGAIELMVCEYRSDGSIRAYARFDEAKVQSSQADNTPILGEGTLALTVDQGQHMERYQGIVSIDSKGLEFAAETYFKQSEQLPSEIKLAAGKLATQTSDGMKMQWVAGGILAQHMPPHASKPMDLDDGRNLAGEYAHDNWLEAKALINTLAQDELLDPIVGAERVIYRLFHERGATKFDPITVLDNCGCSIERIKVAMSGLTDEELDDVFEDGEAKVDCEFCSTRYHFARDALSKQ